MENQLMRAARVTKFGAADVIEIVNNFSIPVIEKPTQILVKVFASGVNPVDTYVRAGTYSKLPNLPYTPGKDGAGSVEDIGSDVTNLKKGDRVWFTMSQTGSAAEFCLAEYAYKLPDRDVILVHGASGGVGLACVQLAKWKGIEVVGTAGSAEGLDMLSANGAKAYNHKQSGYIDAINRDYPYGFNLILEMAAHVNLGTDLSLLASNGKVAVIGNRTETTINARLLMQSEGSIFGVALARSTPTEYKEMSEDIIKFLSSTSVRPVINNLADMKDLLLRVSPERRKVRAYALENMSQSHKDILNNAGARGNLVLNVQP